MEIKCNSKLGMLFFIILLLNVVNIDNSHARVSVPSREVLSEFQAEDSEDSIIGQVFFRFPVQLIWSYPQVSSNIIFAYVRPIGMVGTNIRSNPAFNKTESISVQKDFSGIFDKIEYEGTIIDGGFLIIQLNGNYEFSVHQGDKFESIAIIIHKNIPAGSIDSEKLEVIEEKNKFTK
ncbi:hypothetical protein MNBD_GAMMA22-1031 [hydrothermal vent metagenome]|uniref:Uncharacterized protein n=1 Tax=hydrothermal vent metagenome TaxID=652676 RepID=A0A3B0ZT38_9ZZZZ